MGKLYLVATPIGNLGDISQRALDTLSQCDFIAAEDTRVTQKLLNRFEIKKPTVSYYEHNRAASGERIIQRILAGENCALVSDAGTPVISDPGFDLVQLCEASGIEVLTIPGPCAAISALTLSALPAGRFTFEGFLSVNKRQRSEHLAQLRDEKRTMVFYEAPHKLIYTLRDMLAAFGDRHISLCRELTKLHEETRRTTLAAAVEYYTENAPRGEFVLVVEGAPEVEPECVTLEQGAILVLELYNSGTRMKDAAKQVSLDTGLNKNELYDAALKLKEE